MNIPKSLVEVLKQKLAVGNTRSILLNAVPGNLTTRLQVSDLNIVQQGLADSFLDSLTSKKAFDVKFTIDISKVVEDDKKKKLSRVSKRITSIKYDHDDFYKEHGIETFGFGYPLLFRRNPKDPTKYIVAPIFIWKLNLVQSYVNANEWIISRNQDHEIRLNEVLASYLESEEKILIPPLPVEMMDDSILDSVEINQFVDQILKQLSIDSEAGKPESTESIPDKVDLNNSVYMNTKIMWSGVFGIYKSQKQSLIKDVETLLADFDNIINEEVGETLWEQVHSPYEVDPSQNTVIRSLGNHNNLVIQGPPGTGKSQTLTALILSALSNNKKVLVVCEKRTASEVIKSNLENAIPELSSCIGLVEDVSRDRTVIVDKVRNRTAAYLSRLHHLKSLVKDDVNRFEFNAKQIDSQYNELRQPIWRNSRWKDMVGEWLKRGDKSALKDQLFSFQKLYKEVSAEENYYQDLKVVVEEAGRLFSPVVEKISFLEAKVRNRPDYESGDEREVAYTLRTQVQELGDIKSRLSVLNGEYERATINQVTRQVEDCKALLVQASDIWNYCNKYNVDPTRITFFVRLKSIFSSAYKIAITKANDLKDITTKINQEWIRIFGQSNTLNVAEGLAFLDSNSDRLRNEAVVKNSNSVAAKLNKAAGFDEQNWRSCINRVKEVEVDINKDFIVESCNVENTKVTEVTGAIDNLIRECEQILSEEKYYRDYFRWKRFIVKVSSDHGKWISALRSFEINRWVGVVDDAWLYYRLIKEDKDDRFPVDDNTLNSLRKLGVQIKKNQKDLILYNLNQWFLTGEQKVKSKGMIINQLYNLRGPKGGKRNSLRTIINTDVSSFSDFFPVLMLNPQTCSSLLPLKRGLFDIVIFDEASQLRIEDTFTSLLRAKQVVVSGDSQQMPPSSYFESNRQFLDDQSTTEDADFDSESEGAFNQQVVNDSLKDMALKESLLQFAIDSGYKQTYLDMHYRSRHPDLIEFSNASFYNSRLVPMPAYTDVAPISYKNVDGVFENGENDVEAREVIRILKEDIDPKYSVGVATFNIQQRNYIRRIIDEERLIDPIFNSKMSKLDGEGFFVKNLENIQGDERDVIILSTTFGKKQDGKFHLKFGPIGQENGHRLLNVIITRAKYKVYVVSSIPEVRISEWRPKIEADRSVNRWAGLFAYLDYAKKVSEGDVEGKEEILNFIRAKTNQGNALVPQAGLGLTESPFEEEVYRYLYEVLGDRVYPQYKCGGFIIDFVVLPKDSTGNKMLAIECDGAAYHSDDISWHYDMYRQEQLEKNGFVFHRIWSTNWWRETDTELKKLFQVIDIFCQ